MHGMKDENGNWLYKDPTFVSDLQPVKPTFMGVVSTNTGLRYDEGKAPISLIPPDIILAYAEHMRKGATKYQPRNWEKGMNWSRCYDSLQRHALAWFNGEDYDQETGSHHMIAVVWNAGALFWYSLKGIGKDDRPKYEGK